MYNKKTMLSRNPAPPLAVTELRHLDAVSLLAMCADDRENFEAWAEFLRRYGVKIKYFINGTFRQVLGHSADQCGSNSAGAQESDLFQNVILRLVENNCAVMKKFSGKTENELFAYLAVICRSSVLDSLRRSNASKRRPVAIVEGPGFEAAASHLHVTAAKFEREILAREVVALARQTIHSHSGHVSGRDQLVFDLHFFEGLSCSQIAQCKGIGLSKAGVEKLLKRLVGRVQDLASSGKSEETLQ